MTLKEFVVGFGFEIDEQGLNKVNETMNKVAENVSKGMDKINQNAEKINEFSQKLIDGVKKGVDGIKKKITDLPIAKGIASAMTKAEAVVKGGINVIKAGFDGLKKIGTTISMNPFIKGIKSGLDTAKGVASNGIKGIKNIFSGANKDIKGKLDLKPFVDGIKRGLSNAGKTAKAGLSKIKGLFTKFSSGLKGVGGKLQSQIQGIFSLQGAAIFTAVSVATKKVYDGVKKIITGFTELNRETYATDKAMEIMGKTMEEIQADPNLLAEFNELKSTVDSIGLPPELPESVELLEELGKGVRQLKMNFDIFLKWVGYNLLKHLDKPLRDVKDLLDKLNKWIAKNMQKITDTIGKAIAKAVKVIQHVFQFLSKVFGVAKKVLDKIPDSIKKIGAAFAVLWFMLKKNPLVAILSIIGLLIDDFMTFLEGGESALGGLWKVVMDFINKLGGIDGIIDKVMSFATVAIGWVIDVVKTLIQWVKNMWKWLKESGTLEKLKTAFISIFNSAVNIIKLVITTIMKLWDSLKESGILEKIGKLIATVFTIAIQLISDVIGFIVKLWQKISDSGALDKIFGVISNVFGFIISTIQSIIGWFSNLWGEVSEGGGTFNKIIDVVSSFISTVVDLIATVADLVIGFFKLEPVQAWFETLGKIIGTVVKGAIQLVIDTIGVLKNIIDTIVKLVKGDFQGAFKSAGDAITGIFKGVSNILGGVKNLVGDIVGGIGKVVKSGINTITGGGKTAGHAEGGIFNKEHMANFAEGDKMEAVVPLEGPNKKKGVGIAQKVNSILGLNNESKMMPMMKQAMSKIFEATAMMKDMQTATQAYNDITNENTVNNTYNTSQPIQLTVQVQMPAGGKVSTQEAQRFGKGVGEGMKPYLNGILMDNRQGVFV